MSVVAANNVNKSGKAQGRGNAPIKNIPLEEIWIGARMRPVKPARVTDLVASLREVGLNTPLSVRASSEPTKTGSRPWILVAGAHRLAAAKELGWKRIRCEIFRGTEAEARIWEIRENLDRAELTALEKAEHVAGLIRLKMQEGVSSQDETKPQGRSGGRPEGGLRAAARALGIDKMRASRSLAIAALPTKVKAKIRAAELDDKQALLLNLAKEPNEEAQLAKLSEIARRPTRERTRAKETSEDTTQRHRHTQWQALVALAASRLGRDRSRFVRWALDMGGSDLSRFATAVRDWQPSLTGRGKRPVGNDGPQFLG